MEELKDKLKEIDLEESFDIYSLFDKEPEKTHPAELAQVLDTVPLQTCHKLFNKLNDGVKTDVFPYLGLQMQHKIMRILPTTMPHLS